MKISQFLNNSLYAITFIAAALLLPGCGSKSTVSSLQEAPPASNKLYVCATGDNSAPSDGTCAHAFNADGFNTAENWGPGANKVSAGNTVIIKDDGGAYMSTFTIQGSGTAGNPITIQAESGDSPVISGEAFINGPWTATGTNSEYKVSFSKIPYSVFEDSATVMDCLVDETPQGWGLYSGNTYSTQRLYYVPAVVYAGGAGLYVKLTRGTDKNSLSAGQWIEGNILDVRGRKLYVHAPGDVDLSAQPKGYVLAASKEAGSLSPSSCAYDVINQELYVKTKDGSAPAANEISY
ncbi:MAG TPA: hypothetical protein ENG95_01140, partial [Nitrospirae bacterium]|nr:hypothetical protein [Nitrospirota bacterium]